MIFNASFRKPLKQSDLENHAFITQGSERLETLESRVCLYNINKQSNVDDYGKNNENIKGSTQSVYKKKKKKVLQQRRIMFEFAEQHRLRAFYAYHGG